LSRCAIAALLLAGFWVQAGAQGIYTCVDSKGRTLTADRPIAECTDRTQKELNPSGTVKRQVGPSLTAAERAVEEEKARQIAAENARLAEEKRRDRALLTRYPSRAIHDQERASALTQVDEVILAATKRTGELAQQRKSIDVELEFYKQDPGKIPPRLKRQIDENNHSVDVQKRFIADQESEKQRVNARFDEELVKLKELWARQALPVTAAAPASARKP
jgi:hypothetical protein